MRGSSAPERPKHAAAHTGMEIPLLSPVTHLGLTNRHLKGKLWENEQILSEEHQISGAGEEIFLMHTRYKQVRHRSHKLCCPWLGRKLVPQTWGETYLPKWKNSLWTKR